MGVAGHKARGCRPAPREPTALLFEPLSANRGSNSTFIELENEPNLADRGMRGSWSAFGSGCGGVVAPELADKLKLRCLNAKCGNLADILFAFGIPRIVRRLHAYPDSGAIAEQFP